MFKISRRLMIKLMALAGAVAAMPKTAWGYLVDGFRTRTIEPGKFQFSPATGKISYENGKEEDYALTVEGLVEKPASFSYSELAALPAEEQVSDFHCVEGWTVPDVNWGGVRPAEIFARVKLKPEAGYAVFHSLGKTSSRPGGLDHYVECLPVEDLINPELQYLLALTLDGAPLSRDRGAPLRLVTPFDLAYKSIKFVRHIELTAEPVDGWWTRANSIYSRKASVPAHRLREPDPRKS